MSTSSEKGLVACLKLIEGDLSLERGAGVRRDWNQVCMKNQVLSQYHIHMHRVALHNELYV